MDESIQETFYLLPIFSLVTGTTDPLEIGAVNGAIERAKLVPSSEPLPIQAESDCATIIPEGPPTITGKPDDKGVESVSESDDDRDEEEDSDVLGGNLKLQ